MKILLTVIILLLSCAGASAQGQWVQTASTPQGSGVTDMLITNNGTILVATGSITGGQQGGIRRSSNGGNSWENVAYCYVGRTLCAGSNGHIYASYWEYPAFTESLYRSTNDGVTWTVVHRLGVSDNIFAIAEKDNNNNLFIGTRYGVKRSTNGGANWSLVSSGPTTWVKDILVKDNTVYAATVSGVFKSANNGDNWVQMSGVQAGDTIVKLSFYNGPGDFGNSQVVAGTQNGKMYEEGAELFLIAFTTGQAQETSGFGSLGMLILLSQFSRGNDPGFVYVVGKDGPSWQPRQVNEGLTGNRPISAVAVPPALRGDNFTAYIGYFENTNNGAKIFKRDMNTSVQQVSSEIPEGFELKQNYPNPFNPSTNFGFRIANFGPVTLKVYDINGQEVRTLVNKSLAAGSYSVTFDGTGLTSGVYFYTLQTGEFKETKKMLLLK
jgi:hypothetical protein